MTTCPFYAKDDIGVRYGTREAKSVLRRDDAELSGPERELKQREALLLVVLRGLLGTLSVAWGVAVALNYAAPLIALGRFAAEPTRSRYKANQLGVALALLGSHSLVVAGVAVARGLTWT